MKVGILGCGFTGQTIAKHYVQNGIPVWGTSRQDDKFAQFEDNGIKPVLFDGQEPSDQLMDTLSDTTHLIISIAPPRQENKDHPQKTVDPVLNAFGSDGFKVAAPKLKWIVYLSTVGVYGNHDGLWIDESVELKPKSERSRQRVRAEKEWLEFARVHDLPLSIFRLSGIYGPGRNALVSAQAGKSRRLIKQGQVFNRIHVFDIANAVAKAAEIKAAGIFNITDNEPAPPQDVVSFAHDLLNMPAPPPIDFEVADLSPMARSFYGENKRVSNAKSKSHLKFDYEWPNYRQALKRMYDEDCWKAEVR